MSRLPASGPNAEQIEYWDSAGGAKWVANQEELDARIEPLGLLALDCAAPAAGERALDVGCGCGATSLELAVRVGANGRVLGVDLSALMLERARRRAASRGLSQLRFEQADAQTRDFGAGSFEVVVSRFGVMFFSDPVAAFANLRRSLAPGGRLAFVCWRELADNPWAALPFRAVAEALAAPPPPALEPGAPGPFALADSARVDSILDRAGFAERSIEARKGELDLARGGGLEAAAEFGLEMGPAGRLLLDAGAAERARARDALHSALRPHLAGDRVPLRASVWLVSARNPG